MRTSIAFGRRRKPTEVTTGSPAPMPSSARTACPDAGLAQCRRSTLDRLPLPLGRRVARRADDALEARGVEPLGDLHREILRAAVRADTVCELHDPQPAPVAVPRGSGAVRGIRNR